MDSTVCLLMARERVGHVVSLGIDHGQRSVELWFARHQCQQYGIERQVLKLEWQKPSRVVPEGRPIDEIGREVSSAFLPGRNLAFLAIACAHAAGIEASQVWTGINCVNFSGYPDCTLEFFDAFVGAAALAIPKGPSVVAPLLKWSKPEIAGKA